MPFDEPQKSSNFHKKNHNFVKYHSGSCKRSNLSSSRRTNYIFNNYHLSNSINEFDNFQVDDNSCTYEDNNEENYNNEENCNNEEIYNTDENYNNTCNDISYGGDYNNDNCEDNSGCQEADYCDDD